MLKLLKKYANYSLNNMPLINILDFFVSGNPKYLSRLRIGWLTDPQEITDAYMKASGDIRYIEYKSIQNELINLKYKFEELRASLILLSLGKTDDYNYITVKHKLKQADANRVNNECKALILKIEIKEKQYQNYLRTQGSENKENIKDVTLKGLETLSRYQHYELNANKLTVTSYLNILKDYNKEVENVRQHK